MLVYGNWKDPVYMTRIEEVWLVMAPFHNPHPVLLYHQLVQPHLFHLCLYLSAKIWFFNLKFKIDFGFFFHQSLFFNLTFRSLKTRVGKFCSQIIFCSQISQTVVSESMVKIRIRVFWLQRGFNLPPWNNAPMCMNVTRKYFVWRLSTMGYILPPFHIICRLIFFLIKFDQIYRKK